MLNESTPSTLGCFFLFACCIMALEASAYFLPGAFEKRLPRSSQQSCTQKLSSRPGLHILEPEQKGAHWCKLGLAKSSASLVRKGNIWDSTECLKASFTAHLLYVPFTLLSF